MVVCWFVSIQTLFVDRFVQGILRQVDEDQNTIELQGDGSWKVHLEEGQAKEGTASHSTRTD